MSGIFTNYLHDHLGNTRVTYSVEVKAADDMDYTVQSATDYYPYGKALRTYGKERYQSTYHERDVESGFDYRGARFYDGDVVRFNSLDPLAADYPEFSDYLYVAGNPIIFIDPNGKNTIYYSENGEELYRSEDGLENAVVIVSADNLDSFNELLKNCEICSSDASQTDIDAQSSILRGLGINYMVDEMIDLLDESVKTPAEKDHYYMKDGSAMSSERSSALVQDGNIVLVDTSSPSQTFNQPDYASMQAIHTHPNGYIEKGVMKIRTGIPQDGPIYDFGGSSGAPPSDPDRSSYVNSGRKSKGIRDVVVSPTNIWIYNDSESQDVGAPINFFKQK